MPVVVQVRGPGALFTRPGLTAERMTYSVMTPTAATGVLTAIFWKPEIRYRIQRIEVLNPVKTFTLRRNETTDLPSLGDAVSRGRTVDTAANRVQRNALCLKDVEYRIHAHIEVQAGAGKNEAAYRDQLRRRVERGSCFSQPYLGTREFPAEFGVADDRKPIALSGDLGVMLHSIDYSTTPRQSRWFRAKLRDGVMEVPRDGIGDDALPEA
ncbi:type I-C CRISPR-associated protein Cas5c [Nocardia huaxiensis]|uniref:type I-C CRISPR-associated protein Cas5c n=1 Tax=Nocardia huaxiensis TaxID=2755382 RepID=UPI001C66889E|nr:type I-C CRISPR-associated protein Cas5c [Nocardia huaxiensis]